MRLLHGIEKSSDHPLAAPVVRYLEDSGIESISGQVKVESITGKGIRAVAEENVFLVGNKILMDEHGIEIDDELIISF